MHRRYFLSSVIQSAAALAVAPSLVRAAQYPWQIGWKTVGVETLGPTVATIEGRWPAELAGVLYRNGPAWFDRAGFRYQHWFDGDGMLHAWRIGQGKVRHSAKMIATHKFVREQREGRFVMPTGGTTVPDAISIRNNDDVNAANTAVVRLGNRVLALWEAGSAVEIDPDALASRGLVTWREDLIAAPFSAHPLFEQDGSAWNFGSLSLLGGAGLLIWRLNARGELVKTTMLAMESQGYLHSFAMTPRYLVFMFMPYTQRTDAGGFFERLQFATEQSCRIAVVPKDALDTPRWHECDFAAIFHFADAYERGDEVVMCAVCHHDAEEARSPMGATMRGLSVQHPSDTELISIRLSSKGAQARWERHGFPGLEFPLYDTRTPGTQPARIFAPTRALPNESPYFNAVTCIDAEKNRTSVHRYGNSVMAEEHVFIPKSRGSRPGEGWLVGTLLDYGRKRSGIAVLDAERVSDGPIAHAWLPYTMPLGFHGCFVSS